jgi:hypothetical protein
MPYNSLQLMNCDFQINARSYAMCRGAASQRHPDTRPRRDIFTGIHNERRVLNAHSIKHILYGDRIGNQYFFGYSAITERVFIPYRMQIRYALNARWGTKRNSLVA